MKHFLSILLLLSFCQTSYATITTGSELQEMCKSDDQKAQGVCLGTISGISETTQIYQGMGYIPKIYCAKSMSRFELAEVIVSYLDDHPQILEKQAGVIFLTAMKEKFPCK